MGGPKTRLKRKHEIVVLEVVGKLMAYMLLNNLTRYRQQRDGVVVGRSGSISTFVKRLHGCTFPGKWEVGRSDRRVDDGGKRIADNRTTSNQSRGRDTIKTTSTPRFKPSKSSFTPFRGCGRE